MANCYRKKPVVIKAWRLTAEIIGRNPDDKEEWEPDEEELRGIIRDDFAPTDDGRLMCARLEGSVVAKAGDWIIKGVKGEAYPCDDEIFRMTYELAD